MRDARAFELKETTLITNEVHERGEAMTSNVTDAGQTLLLTMVETAALLRIGRTQTYELVMSGRIPSVTIGRRRLVVRTGIEAFVRGLMSEQETA